MCVAENTCDANLGNYGTGWSDVTTQTQDIATPDRAGAAILLWAGKACKCLPPITQWRLSGAACFSGWLCNHGLANPNPAAVDAAQRQWRRSHAVPRDLRGLLGLCCCCLMDTDDNGLPCSLICSTRSVLGRAHRFSLLTSYLNEEACFKFAIVSPHLLGCFFDHPGLPCCLSRVCVVNLASDQLWNRILLFSAAKLHQFEVSHSLMCLLLAT